MKDFYQLKKNLKKDSTSFLDYKIAILGDTSTQFLATAIKGMGYDKCYNLEIWEADFNQIELQIINIDSELYKFQPDVIILFFSTHKLLNKYNKLKTGQIDFANNEIDNYNNLINIINNRIQSKIIIYNFPEQDDSVFGNFSNKMQSSFLYQLRKLNFDLMNFSINQKNMYIVDLSNIQNLIGQKHMFQPSIYINTEMVLSIESLPLIASRTLDLISAFIGRVNKCLILDLDNTTWGGIIGDDGVENIQIGNIGIGKAFTEFQFWVKKLVKRGIIVAICSKNNENIAKEPFLKHPDMILKMEDISVFIANWENKADNIRHIQSILNIGFDSMVFLDDNPFERNLVRENIPEITIPELPEDPAEYLHYLYSLNLFETTTTSNEDSERTKLYQIEAQRSILQKNFTNETDFLSSLNMLSIVEDLTKFNIPRISQLSQRSNQFNLRTVRYDELMLEQISNSTLYKTLSFTLEDRFGDNGLICVIILNHKDDKNLFIENWFMSCRVLKRGMEDFTINCIVEYAIENSFEYIIGEYIPTAKNMMVKDHYSKLGFEMINNQWILNVKKFIPKTTYITKK